MARYIELDALVTEIKRLKADALQKKSQCKRSGLERIMHQIGAYNKILSLINTVEVKEVDLIKEVAYWKIDHQVYGMDETFYDIAKYFFELGISVSNPTTADRGIVEEIIFTLNTLGEEKMISYDKEIEWLRNKVKKIE